jgi:hypothetical protein
MPPIPVRSPANFTPTVAISYSDGNGDSAPVRLDAPLPVMAVSSTPAAALTGTSAVTAVVGPFVPVAARAIVLTLNGSWVGQVRVLRSTDSGITKLPLTAAGSGWAVFTANCCEAVWEESEAGVQLYLDIALTSGNVTYRLSQ